MKHHYFINSLDASHTKSLGLFLAEAHKANEIVIPPIPLVNSQSNKQLAKAILDNYVPILKKVSSET